MYATAGESAKSIRGMYQRSLAHANATFAATDLDDVGTVPWWPEDRRHPTLHTVIIHILIETTRHTKHLNILHELINNNTKHYKNNKNIPNNDIIN